MNPGSAIALQGGVNYSYSQNTVTINGTGDSLPTLTPPHLDALDNLGGNNTFAGSVTMVGPSTIGSSTGTLTLTGEINSSFSP